MSNEATASWTWEDVFLITCTSVALGLLVRVAYKVILW